MSSTQKSLQFDFLWKKFLGHYRSTRGVVDWLRLNGELRSVPEALMAAIRAVAVTDATEDQARSASFAPGVAARAEDVAALSDPNPQQRVWALLDRLAQGPVR